MKIVHSKRKYMMFYNDDVVFYIDCESPIDFFNIRFKSIFIICSEDISDEDIKKVPKEIEFSKFNYVEYDFDCMKITSKIIKDDVKRPSEFNKLIIKDFVIIITFPSRIIHV